MLEHVALGQSRFMTPGVAPDPRGVLLGRYGLLSFATLEGVVSWLRIYSAESSLDELLAGMEIGQAVTPLASREMLVRIPATSSYTLDRAGRCAGLCGGTIYTGTSKYFVKYRDDSSPYGYDAVEIQALPRGADLMLLGEDFSQTYRKEGTLPFDRLLFRLSLRRVPGSDKLRPEERAELVLVVARGLGDGVIRYLWRNRVTAGVALVKPRGKSAFGGERDASYLLMRVQNLPERILDLFIATPGIDVFRQVTPQVAVQVGFTHLIDLASCASVFSEQGFYLFWGYSHDSGRLDRVDILDGPVEVSGIENLTRIHLDVEKTPVQARLDSADADVVGVSIRLAPSLSPPRNVIASLVPLEHGPMLKRMVYFLPQSSLRSHRVVVTDRGILLLASEDLDVIPLGQILCELAPGLLVPLGMDLVPRVAPDVLGRALGHGAGLLTVFPHDGKPFQISEGTLQPLERRSLAKIEVERTQVMDMRIDPSSDPSVINEPVGRFALWGYPSPSNK